MADDLLEQYVQMHEANPQVFAGFSLWPHIRRIKSIFEETDVKRVLDFGAGKGAQYQEPLHCDGGDYTSLEDYWGAAVTLYDPAVDRHNAFPDGEIPFDAVVCTDVLEHLPLDEIRAAIDLLFSVATRAVYISVHCEEAIKSLPDGRNCHETVRPPDWWLGILESVVSAHDDCPFWALACRSREGEVIYGPADSEWNPPPAYRHARPGDPLPPPKRPLFKVHTRNCVDEGEILEQIRYAEQVAEREGWSWVERSRPHDKTAAVVSGGPSWTEHLDDLSDAHSQGEYLFCVKSSHDWLLKHDIVPYGCFLLDPRPLVGDYVREPHPEIRYLVASMCHQSVIDHLVGTGANVTMYHALVGAGEDKFIKHRHVISGGSTAATRGMSILRTLGFRDFRCYGFDSCYDTRPAGVLPDYESAHRDEQHIPVDLVGTQIYAMAEGVEAQGVVFNTDPQLVAQVQDLIQFRHQAPECRTRFYGRGLGTQVMNAYLAKERNAPHFTELLEAA